MQNDFAEITRSKKAKKVEQRKERLVWVQHCSTQQAARFSTVTSLSTRHRKYHSYTESSYSEPEPGKPVGKTGTQKNRKSNGSKVAKQLGY